MVEVMSKNIIYHPHFLLLLLLFLFLIMSMHLRCSAIQETIFIPGEVVVIRMVVSGVRTNVADVVESSVLAVGGVASG